MNRLRCVGGAVTLCRKAHRDQSSYHRADRHLLPIRDAFEQGALLHGDRNRQRVHGAPTGFGATFGSGSAGIGLWGCHERVPSRHVWSLAGKVYTCCEFVVAVLCAAAVCEIMSRKRMDHCVVVHRRQYSFSLGCHNRAFLRRMKGTSRKDQCRVCPIPRPLTVR